MPGLLERGIDRELGTAGEASSRRRKRDSWLRDWPLLLGLILSAGLIAASTTVGGTPPRPETALTSKTASTAGGAIPGQVVDVGENEEAEPAPADAQPARKRARKKPAATDGAGAADSPSAPAEAAADVPAEAPARRSPGMKRTPAGRSGGSPGGSTAQPGRIVNVTGTRATFANGPMSYSFAAPTHKPVVGRRWRLQLGARNSGAPATGTVKIDILHNGAVVGHVTSGKLAGGRFAHDFDWPERSVGVPLTVKTTIVGGGFQQSFLFKVQVAKAG